MRCEWLPSWGTFRDSSNRLANAVPAAGSAKSAFNPAWYRRAGAGLEETFATRHSSLPLTDRNRAGRIGLFCRPVQPFMNTTLSECPLLPAVPADGAVFQALPMGVVRVRGRVFASVRAEERRVGKE